MGCCNVPAHPLTYSWCTNSAFSSQFVHILCNYHITSGRRLHIAGRNSGNVAIICHSIKCSCLYKWDEHLLNSEGSQHGSVVMLCNRKYDVISLLCVSSAKELYEVLDIEYAKLGKCSVTGKHTIMYAVMHLIVCNSDKSRGCLYMVNTRLIYICTRCLFNNEWSFAIDRPMTHVTLNTHCVTFTAFVLFKNITILPVRRPSVQSTPHAKGSCINMPPPC